MTTPEVIEPKLWPSIPMWLSFIRRVRGAIAVSLATGPPAQASVARRLGVSMGTLQRRLDEAGYRYRDLVADHRRSTALQMLAAPSATVAEVAYATGYADVASFSRAFRRWMGVNPGAYRPPR